MPDGTDPWDLEPGDYCFRGSRLWMNLPDGSGARTIDHRWKITENEDKTITVTPSIEDLPPNGYGWHGFLTNGIWTQVNVTDG